MGAVLGANYPLPLDSNIWLSMCTRLPDFSVGKGPWSQEKEKGTQYSVTSNVEAVSNWEGAVLLRGPLSGKSFPPRQPLHRSSCNDTDSIEGVCVRKSPLACLAPLEAGVMCVPVVREGLVVCSP